MAVIAAGFIIFLAPLYAQEQPPVETPVFSEEGIILGESPSQEALGSGASIWIVLRMVLVLAVAALAIYGVVFFIKRLARPPRTRDPHLKVLASVPLGGDTFAAVISVGAKAWLIGGSSSGNVSLMSAIEDQEALESMLLDEAQKSAETANRFLDFRSLLYRLGGVGGGNRNQHESDLNIHADSLRKHRDRLKGL
jgi:flagellar protein FliO/FliZ